MYSQGGAYNSSPSQFGGFGGGQGGGFLASPGGGGMLSQGGGQGGSGSTRMLVPVTCRQVVHAEEQGGKFLVDGFDPAQIKLIARIMQMTPRETFTEFAVHDGTAPLDIKFWTDKDETGGMQENESKYREGQYVKIIGKINAFQNKRQVNAHVVIPLTDMNELSYHMLECMFVHRRRAVDVQGGMAGAAPTQQANGYTANGGFQQQQGYGGQMGMAGSAPTQPGGGFDQNMAGSAGGAGGGDSDQLQQQVLSIFQQDQSEAGASISTVFNRLSGVPPNQIRQVIDYLATEGSIYSTIDEEHYKTT